MDITTKQTKSTKKENVFLRWISLRDPIFVPFVIFVIAVERFMTGAFSTVLAEDEILVGLRIPKFSAGARWGYYKFCRKTGEFAQTWHRNGKLIEEEGHVTDLLTKESVQFIGKKRSGPFFLYVPFTIPHLALQVPELLHRLLQHDPPALHHRAHEVRGRPVRDLAVRRNVPDRADCN